MHAGLVGKSTFPDVGPVFGGTQIGNLIQQQGQTAQLGQLRTAGQPGLHFEGQGGDDGAEIGVAGPFSIPVDGALDHGGAGFDRGQRIGHRQLGVVVRVNAQDDPRETRRGLRGDARHLRGQAPAVGVAQDQGIGTGVRRGLQGLQGVIRVVQIAVEEMFRVVEDLFPMLLEPGH